MWIRRVKMRSRTACASTAAAECSRPTSTIDESPCLTHRSNSAPNASPSAPVRSSFAPTVRLYCTWMSTSFVSLNYRFIMNSTQVNTEYCLHLFLSGSRKNEMVLISYLKINVQISVCCTLYVVQRIVPYISSLVHKFNRIYAYRRLDGESGWEWPLRFRVSRWLSRARRPMRLLRSELPAQYAYVYYYSTVGGSAILVL